mmetsp:Transcript_10204/g.25625  ORF Transcript_10204/g.25625 Transcript_10204/m.25625 type:complete len:220 (-) Transcript_10204:64-723(-)
MVASKFFSDVRLLVCSTAGFLRGCCGEHLDPMRMSLPSVILRGRPSIFSAVHPREDASGELGVSGRPCDEVRGVSLEVVRGESLEVATEDASRLSVDCEGSALAFRWVTLGLGTTTCELFPNDTARSRVGGVASFLCTTMSAARELLDRVRALTTPSDLLLCRSMRRAWGSSELLYRSLLFPSRLPCLTCRFSPLAPRPPACPSVWPFGFSPLGPSQTP